MDDGKLVYGVLPDGEGTGSGESAGGSVPSQSTKPTQNHTSSGGQASVGDLQVTMTYNDNSTSANAIAGTLEIKNTGSDSVDLSDLWINYYFTDDGANMVFDCYHAAINSSSGQYTALTDDVSAEFSTCSGEDRDTCLSICPGSGTLEEGDTLTISFSCHRDDWQNMDLSNDWSHKSVDNIEIVA
jgi:endoglucanase